VFIGSYQLSKSTILECTEIELPYMMDKINYILYQYIKSKRKHCDANDFYQKFPYDGLKLIINDKNNKFKINLFTEKQNMSMGIIIFDEDGPVMDNHKIFENNDFYNYVRTIFKKINDAKNNREKLIELYYEYTESTLKIFWWHTNNYLSNEIIDGMYYNITEYYESNNNHTIN